MKQLIKFSILTLILCFFSNFLFAQRNNQKRSRKSKKIEIPTVKTPQIADESPQPYFTGGGNEPFWSIEILQGMDASLSAKIKTYYDNERQYEAVLVKKVIRFADSERTVFVNKEESAKPKFELQFVEQKCTDDGDITHDARVILKINDKEFNGCGDFAANMPLEIGGKYTLKELDGKAVKKENHVTIDVFKKTMSANMGCNTMFGFFSANKQNINRINLASTMMACKDMQLETNFGRVSALVNGFSYDKNELIFLDEKFNKIMILKKK